MGRKGMSWKFPFTEGGLLSGAASLRGPSTRVSLQTSFFIASSGFTQGPPVSLQPPELCIVISRPKRSHSAAAWCSMSCHSGVL